MNAAYNCTAAQARLELSGANSQRVNPTGALSQDSFPETVVRSLPLALPPELTGTSSQRVNPEAALSQYSFAKAVVKSLSLALPPELCGAVSQRVNPAGTFHRTALPKWCYGIFPLNWLQLAAKGLTLQEHFTGQLCQVGSKESSPCASPWTVWSWGGGRGSAGAGPCPRVCRPAASPASSDRQPPTPSLDKHAARLLLNQWTFTPWSWKQRPSPTPQLTNQGCQIILQTYMKGNPLPLLLVSSKMTVSMWLSPCLVSSPVLTPPLPPYTQKGSLKTTHMCVYLPLWKWAPPPSPHTHTYIQTQTHSLSHLQRVCEWKSSI